MICPSFGTLNLTNLKTKNLISPLNPKPFAQGRLCLRPDHSKCHKEVEVLEEEPELLHSNVLRSGLRAGGLEFLLIRLSLNPILYLEFRAELGSGVWVGRMGRGMAPLTFLEGDAGARFYCTLSGWK